MVVEVVAVTIYGGSGCMADIAMPPLLNTQLSEFENNSSPM